MKKLFTFLSAMLLSVGAFAQTFNGGTWYSLYDTEEHEMYTIANYTTDNVFAPTAGKLQFKWNYTKWMVGAFPNNATHIYTSADGGSNKVEVAKLTDNTWDTEHSEDITIDANINWLKWDRPTGNTHYVHVWNIAVPLGRHILLSGGDYGKTRVSKTFADAVKFGESASIRADFRSFLTNGDITVSLTEGDAEVFRLGSIENTTDVLASSTAGNSYAVGANACASANGTANACANGQLAKIGNYSFQIYFCPKAVGAASATITITDGTSTATITVNGTGVKGDQVEVPVELSFCSGTSARFRDTDYVQAGLYDYLVQSETQDTLFKVNVTELLPTSSEENKTIAYGAAETWHEVDLSTYAVGNHNVIFNTTNAVGCDSVVTLHLTVTKQQTLEVPVSLAFCTGGSVEFHGNEYTASGVVNLPAEGVIRDTLYVITIVENHPTIGEDEMTIVYGAEESWNGIALKDSTVGVHYVVYETTNAAGCDSTATLTLTVTKQEAVELVENLEFCQGGSVEYRDRTYTEAGTDVINITGDVRDTVVNVTIVELLPSASSEELTINVGAEEEWNDIDLSTYAVGTHTLTYVTENAAGCDSIVTLTLTVEKLKAVEENRELEFCEGDSVEYRGKVYTEAGEDTYEIEGATRDTLVVVTIAVNPNAYEKLEQTVLSGHEIVLPAGEWMIGEETVSGTYPTVKSGETTILTFFQYGQTEKGCEDVKELVVTVESNTEAVDNIFVGEKAEKVFRNGVLYIRRGERFFTCEGREVK